MELKELKPLIVSPHWGLLEEYLAEQVDLEKSALVRNGDIDKIRVLQGKVQAYERILELSERIAAIKR